MRLPCTCAIHIHTTFWHDVIRMNEELILLLHVYRAIKEVSIILIVPYPKMRLDMNMILRPRNCILVYFGRSESHVLYVGMECTQAV